MLYSLIGCISGALTGTFLCGLFNINKSRSIGPSDRGLTIMGCATVGLLIGFGYGTGKYFNGTYFGWVVVTNTKMITLIILVYGIGQ